MNHKNSRTRFAFLAWIVLGALITSACSTAASSNNPVEVQVTLDDMTIQSSLTTFAINVPYHFVVTNKGKVQHELLIMDAPSSGMTSDQIHNLRNYALDAILEDDLTPGATKTMNYTFTEAASAGKLEFACHLPGHYEAGMHLGIVVK